MDISGQTAIITGAGSGIGEALAHAVAAAGARHVAIADLNGDAADHVAKALTDAGASATAHEVDVADETAIVDMVERVNAAHGPVGLFASNAGYVTVGGLEDTNERIEHMFAVHVMSHMYAARAVVPQMIANGGGYLLNTASAAGLLTQIGSMAYSVTKGAAVSLAEWLSVTHHHQGIRVSVLCPQAVDTNIVANSPDLGGPDAIDTGAPANAGEMEGGVAAGDGVVTSEEVAAMCVDALEDERFWVLPHPEVAKYAERKATDVDRWLGGMRRFQDTLAAGGPLPGDAMAPEL